MARWDPTKTEGETVGLLRRRTKTTPKASPVVRAVDSGGWAPLPRGRSSLGGWEDPIVAVEVEVETPERVRDLVKFAHPEGGVFTLVAEDGAWFVTHRGATYGCGPVLPKERKGDRLDPRPEVIDLAVQQITRDPDGPVWGTVADRGDPRHG
jgi:hypothetical protein